MNLIDLGILYLIGGVASALGIWRLHHSLSSSLAALLLWPLWAPVAFMDPKRRPVERREPDGRLGDRIAQVLDDARCAAAGTPFETLLNGAAAHRIGAEVERASERLEGLDAVLSQPEFSRSVILERLATLTAEGASEATIRPARLHLESVERLTAMRAQQAAALAELEQVLAALRSQLVVARYAGAHEGVDGILGDLWARVEGLGAVLDHEPEAGGPEGPEAVPSSRSRVSQPPPSGVALEREAS